jgi:hypothetical protein
VVIRRIYRTLPENANLRREMKKLDRFSNPRTRYDFERMAREGGVWRLAEGEDYTAARTSVQRAAYLWAGRYGHGMKAHTSLLAGDGVVEIEFVQEG